MISLGTPEEDGNHFPSNASHWKTTRVALCNHSWGLEMIVAFRNHLAPYLPCNHFLGSSDHIHLSLQAVVIDNLLFPLLYMKAQVKREKHRRRS